MNNLFLKNHKPQIKASRVTPLEGVSTYAPQGIRVRGVEKTQGFGIDERRFVNINIQHSSEVYPGTTYEMAALSRLRTQMTRIARIFTDPCASASSAQSVFNCPSALFSIHQRLIFEKPNMSYGKVCDSL